MKKSLIFLVSLCFVACSPKEPDVVSITAITGEATQISCRNAVLAGKANLPEVTATDLSFGVLYSTNSGVLLGKADKVEATTFDSEYNYTVTTAALEPETTYYYRSYISQNNEIVYGDTKSFTTLPVSSLIKTEEIGDISDEDLTLRASLDLNNCRYDTLEYGFLFTQGEKTIKVFANNLSNESYSAKTQWITHLTTKYEVQAYVVLDGRRYTAEKKSFKRGGVQASLIVNNPGSVKFGSASFSGILNVETPVSYAKSATLYYSPSETSTSGLQTSGSKQDISLDSDGSFSFLLVGLSGGTTYYYTVVAAVDDVSLRSGVKSFRTGISLPTGVVDMGLSVKWASCNVGASKPEDYGGYFAWGEVAAKSTYDWDTYKWYQDGLLTKYCTDSSKGYADNQITIEKSDDAAVQTIGGKMRIPTIEEWQELINEDNCHWLWTTVNEIEGRLVTSKTTGNSIFLPLAEGHYYNFEPIEKWGNYWSSTLHSNNYDAWYASFTANRIGLYKDSRCSGFAIRPVCDN